MATMTAKYAGRCTACDGRIKAGDAIEYSKDTGARHPRCAAGPQVEPGPLELNGGSGYGCKGWTVGTTILSGEKRRRAGGPDALTIVTASRQYIREDGLSMGIGTDEGYAYHATARPATPEELARVVEVVHGKAIVENRELERGRIYDRFAAGEQLAESEADRLASAPGDTILLDPGEKGGRRWVVVGADSLSLVCGGFYDDYRRSAHRLPRTAELERRIRTIETK